MICSDSSISGAAYSVCTCAPRMVRDALASGACARLWPHRVEQHCLLCPNGNVYVVHVEDYG